MLLAVGSAVLSTEVSTIFPLHEAVGLWLEQMLWLTGIERLLQEEEVDLFQLMLKASFFKLHLLAKQSFRESPLQGYLFVIFLSFSGQLKIRS